MKKVFKLDNKPIYKIEQIIYDSSSMVDIFDADKMNYDGGKVTTEIPKDLFELLKNSGKYKIKDNIVDLRAVLETEVSLQYK